MTTLLSELQSRGCLHDTSHFEELEKSLESESLTFYCGFDPTADSLHAGSMLPLLLMRKLQRRGHSPIALIGSGTGMIGDPSGKSEERKLLSEDVLEANVAGIERQIGIFLDGTGPHGYRLVKNHEWLANLDLFGFLRDVGKHFTVNQMIAKDSVRSRLEQREQGISYTEFSYMLLQAYDFYHLNKTCGCRLQVGGSDQWGNITAGLELIRKKAAPSQAPAFGMTFPLLTTSTGAKFGKTESGAIWLDKEKTSPYRFYQYWLNTADADVIRYLQLFTDLQSEEIAALDAKTTNAPQERAAQKALATDLTTLVHGEDELQRAQSAAEVLFGGSLEQVDSNTLEDIFSDVPSTELPKSDIATGIPLADLLVRCGVAASKAAARRSIEGGGIYLNNIRTEDFKTAVTLQQFIDESVLILRSGKKKYHLVRVN